MWVNLESRYGINELLATKADTTFPNADNDLLMNCASLSLSPTALVFPNLSDLKSGVSK
jgi:hypothetical protein